MLNKFTFKPTNLTCEAALWLAAESNEIATVDYIDYDHSNNVATVCTLSDNTMSEANMLAKHLEIHAPLTRIVFDSNCRPTDYVWCDLGDSNLVLVNVLTGSTGTHYSAEQLSQALFDEDVYAPYEQFE